MNCPIFGVQFTLREGFFINNHNSLNLYNRYKTKNNEYENQKIDLENKLNQIKQPQINIDNAISKVLNFGENFFEIFKSVKIDEKRKILNLIFSNFLLDGKNVEISMRKTYNLLSEIGGCQEWWDIQY